MKKLKKTFSLFLICISYSLHIFADSDQKTKKIEVEEKKQEIKVFLKRNKTKIKIAMMAIAASYFFGAPPPVEPWVLNTYELNNTKPQQLTQSYRSFLKLFFYRVRLTYREMRFLIYLVGNHPLLLLDMLRNKQELNFEEIVYGELTIHREY
jgi:hypothetical protein